jgi:hypothetical protein
VIDDGAHDVPRNHCLVCDARALKIGLRFGNFTSGFEALGRRVLSGYCARELSRAFQRNRRCRDRNRKTVL